MENSQLQSQSDQISEVLAAGGDKAALRVALGGQWDNVDSALGAVRKGANQEIINLEIDEKMMLEDYGPDHPKIVNLRKRKALLIERLGGASLLDTERGKKAKKLDFFETYLRSQREKIRMNEQRVEVLRGLFAQERGLSRQLSDYQVQNEELAGALEAKKSLFSYRNRKGAPARYEKCVWCYALRGTQ